MECVELRGLRIAYERSGSGPAVLLLHGGISDHREWRAQIDALSDEFTVVAWDAPGCGRSSDPPETFRLHDYAGCLAELVDALDLHRPHVVGLSFGSTLALELFRQAPGLSRTLVLASAYAGWAGSLSTREVADRVEQMLRDLELSREEFVRIWLPTLFTDDAPPEMVEELSAIMAEYHPAGVRSMVHSMAEADLRDVLPGIDVPTLLLYGESDTRSPLTVAQGMKEAIPGSTLVLLPEAGHQCNVEAAGRFSEAVRDFLRCR